MELISRDKAKSLGLKRYFTGDPCKYGHVVERQVSSYGCMACQNERVKAAAKKKYAEDPEYKAKINERNRLYNQSETYKEYNRKRISTDAYREYRVNYLSQDHMREKKRAYDRERQQTCAYKAAKRDRYRNDVRYKVACLIRARLRQAIKKAKTAKSSSVSDVDIDKLIQRIELNFKPGMSWRNHGEWHIDHVKPVAAFAAQGRDIGTANTLCNLRPEWRSDNMLKSSKFNGVMYRYKSTQSIRNEEDKG